MTRILASLSLGIALAAGSIPAIAGDFNNGDPAYRGYGRPGGTPVPAPMPIPETFNWYIRADIGLGLSNTPSISESGLVFGAADSIAPFGSSSSWFNPDFETFVTYGLGVGYYVTPRWRVDVTFDVRSQAQIRANGSYTYTQFDLPPAVAVATPTGNIVNGSMSESVTIRGAAGLFNVYYDLTDRGRFTPYVGAGLGFVINEVNRRHATTETVLDAATLAVVGSRGAIGSDVEHSVSVAAMLTAGFSYTLWTSTVFDLNYRYMYLGGSNVGIQVNGANSRLDIGDLHEHQLRAGLRWNIW